MFVGYWVAEILALYGVTGVFVMIGAQWQSSLSQSVSSDQRTNGLSLEALAP